MTNNPGKVVRISYDLDKYIRTLSEKNKVNYINATKDIARILPKLNGKKIKFVNEITF